MAIDIFMKLDGVNGEAQDTKHKNEIEILSYAFGLHQQGTASAGTGLGAGKVIFEDLHFTKRVDKATPNLLVNCATGKPSGTSLITVRKAGGDQQEYLKITMTDVIVSSYNSAGSEGDVPLESISFNFTSVKVEYSPQNADGSLGGAIEGGWNVKTNAKV